MLRRSMVLILSMVLQSLPAAAQVICDQPAEPYPYKLDKSDPLYAVARDEHQLNLEKLEDYLNCLDRERRTALEELKNSYDLFKRNYGKDAVFKSFLEN